MGTAFTAVRLAAAAMVVAAAMPVAVTACFGQDAAAIAISVKGHRFQPAAIHAPANRPIVLRVRNLDPAPMEFESVSLRVEKVVASGSEGVINIRPLSPGNYEFFDDFHQETRGTLVVP